MDKIILKAMSFYGYHGVSQMERKSGQKFYVDIEMTVNLSKAGKTDKLSDTIDYPLVYALVEKIQLKKKYHLMEALAEDISKNLLKNFKKIKEVVVRIRKPQAPVGGVMDYVEIEITRMSEQGEVWGSKIR